MKRFCEIFFFYLRFFLVPGKGKESQTICWIWNRKKSYIISILHCVCSNPFKSNEHLSSWGWFSKWMPGKPFLLLFSFFLVCFFLYNVKIFMAICRERSKSDTKKKRIIKQKTNEFEPIKDEIAKLCANL